MSRDIPVTHAARQNSGPRPPKSQENRGVRGPSGRPPRGTCHDRPMYPGKYAVERADQPAFIMATSGEVVTYGEYEARTNRLAHLLRDQGLQRLDHYSIFMENRSE